MMCFVGLFGLLLMIIETEIVFKQIDHEDTRISWFIKLMITVSTAILICLVLLYHRLDLTLYSVNNSLDDWRVGFTIIKICLMTLEIIICAIHPFPRSFPSAIVNTSTSTSTESTPHMISDMSINIALSLPSKCNTSLFSSKKMKLFLKIVFARLYLLCRVIVYHSHLLRDTSSQSVGYLNQVSINFFFVIKTYLEKWPARCLLILWALSFFIGSWSLRACNYDLGDGHLTMADAMWLFIVTSTTVGYGDLTPVTHCGRSEKCLFMKNEILS
jgi:hypothetical protein